MDHPQQRQRCTPPPDPRSNSAGRLSDGWKQTITQIVGGLIAALVVMFLTLWLQKDPVVVSGPVGPQSCDELTDARQALKCGGIQWQREALINALTQGDVRTVALFVKGVNVYKSTPCYAPLQAVAPQIAAHARCLPLASVCPPRSKSMYGVPAGLRHGASPAWAETREGFGAQSA